MMATKLYRPVGLLRCLVLVPERFNPKGKNAEQQFTVLALSWASSRTAVALELLVLGTTELLNSLALLQNLDRRLPPA
jgi:hypothetical protein